MVFASAVRGGRVQEERRLNGNEETVFVVADEIPEFAQKSKYEAVSILGKS